MIELNHITKSFDGQVALHDVSLFVQEGEIFGIIGKSGAGKSTLLRCVNLLEKPEQGTIQIDGEELTKLKPKALQKARHKTAMIFQHFNLLFSKTVYDNIALPMRIQGMSEEYIAEKINELLPLVELSDKRHAYPGQLSGGQKQRVAIARALSCSPKVLLCDEATSALDPETTDAILNLLKKINQIYGITILLITHEMEVIKRICHRLALMEAGKIIEITSLSGIFSRKDSLARGILYSQLSPSLPLSLKRHLTSTPNGHALLRIFFEGEATQPFISQASRDLNLDINILLANVECFDDLSCGVLIVEISADETLINTFMERGKQFNLSVEILGYVTDIII